MDAVQRANRRLVDLGYSRDEAHFTRTAASVHVGGRVLQRTEIPADDLGAVLAMLPPKGFVVAFELALERD